MTTTLTFNVSVDQNHAGTMEAPRSTPAPR